MLVQSEVLLQDDSILISHSLDWQVDLGRGTNWATAQIAFAAGENSV